MSNRNWNWFPANPEAVHALAASPTQSNPVMTQYAAEQLEALDIDVDQWRREIQTFVDATIIELQATNDELSSEFASGKQKVRAVRASVSSNQAINDLIRSEAVRSELFNNSHDIEQRKQASGNNSFGPIPEMQTDERLTELKRKLAERISPPKNSPLMKSTDSSQKANEKT